MTKLMRILQSIFHKNPCLPTVPLRDYIDIQRGMDFLKHENGALKEKMQKISLTNEAIMRQEIKNIKSDCYDLFKRLEKLLEVEND